MKKNVIIKLISIIIIFLVIFSPISTVQASGITNLIGSGDNFISTGENQTTPINDTNMRDLSNDLYNILLVVGIVIASIIGMILGIQFMTGSVEQKAKVKDSLIPYVAGCVVIFGAFGIWKLVVTLMQGI